MCTSEIVQILAFDYTRMERWKSGCLIHVANIRPVTRHQCICTLDCLTCCTHIDRHIVLVVTMKEGTSSTLTGWLSAPAKNTGPQLILETGVSTVGLVASSGVVFKTELINFGTL